MSDGDKKDIGLGTATGKKPPRKPKYAAKNLPLTPLRPTNDKGLPTKVHAPAQQNVYKIPFDENTGRPSTYNLEIATYLCSQRAQGRALSKICRAEGMPSINAVYDWLRKYPEFAKMFARAEEDMADTLADEMFEIADDGTNDTYIDEDGKKRTDYDNIQRSKLRADVRKWVASKLKSKKWGDKIIHQGDSEQPLVTQLVIDGDALAEKLRKK